MITAAIIFFPNGEVKETITVDSGGVRKIFFNYNKETKTSDDTLVVLTEDNILEYHNFPVAVQKDYSEKE